MAFACDVGGGRMSDIRHSTNTTRTDDGHELAEIGIRHSEVSGLDRSLVRRDFGVPQSHVIGGGAREGG
jgi:hypothetical protein